MAEPEGANDMWQTMEHGREGWSRSPQRYGLDAGTVANPRATRSLSECAFTRNRAP